MSADAYQRLIERLMELEDMLLGKAAKSALSQSQMVGAQTFVETLKQLNNKQNLGEDWAVETASIQTKPADAG